MMREEVHRSLVSDDIAASSDSDHATNLNSDFSELDDLDFSSNSDGSAGSEVVSKPPEDGVEVDTLDDDRKRTIGTVFLFLALMVLYVGLCFLRRKRLEGEEQGRDRETRRRENQAVLDEISNRVTRARQSAEEHAKVEGRKKTITEVLLTRLIVDDEVETKDENSSTSVTSDESAYCSKDDDGSFHQSALSSNRILTIQEIDEDLDETLVKTSSNEGDIEAQINKQFKDEGTGNSSAGGALGNIDEKFEEDNATEKVDEPSPALSTPTTLPPSILRSSSFKRNTDALSCGSCNSSTISLYSQNSSSCCSSSNAAKPLPRNKEDLSTIALSDIALHSEECIICFIQFQIGDRVAWRTKKDGGNAACLHVFHEECISRWLLVRDGCPICRRSYFEE